jgi:molybdenum cofactor guanylyltransferase
MNKPEAVPKQKVTAVILAGGRAQRMGGEDKGLLPVHGKPMIEYIIETLRPQVGQILINANRNLERYQQYGYPVVSDIMGEYFGPLVGMASGIQNSQTEYVVTVPCDSPLLPNDLVSNLYNQLQKEDAELAVAHDGERMQPVFALLRCDLLPDLLHYLDTGGRKIDTWYAQHRAALADFSKAANAFMNINSPSDQEAIENLIDKEELTS